MRLDGSKDADDAHGDTVVAEIIVQCRRNGSMSVAGSITDEMYALAMLETAKDSLRGYHDQRRAGRRSALVVPAYDTALVGTPLERKLIEARDELANLL
jgi:hypothetical protein